MVQLIIMSHQHGEYRERDFNETLTIQFENITEVKMSDLEGNYRSTTEPEIINKLIQHFNVFHYKRLVNDQTAYMPLKTRMIYLYEGDKVNFIIPYGKEVMIDNMVYQVKGGEIDEAVMQELYGSLEE